MLDDVIAGALGGAVAAGAMGGGRRSTAVVLADEGGSHAVYVVEGADRDERYRSRDRSEAEAAARRIASSIGATAIDESGRRLGGSGDFSLRL